MISSTIRIAITALFAVPFALAFTVIAYPSYRHHAIRMQRAGRGCWATCRG